MQCRCRIPYSEWSSKSLLHFHILFPYSISFGQFLLPLSDFHGQFLIPLPYVAIRTDISWTKAYASPNTTNTVTLRFSWFVYHILWLPRPSVLIPDSFHSNRVFVHSDYSLCFNIDFKFHVMLRSTSVLCSVCLPVPYHSDRNHNFPIVYAKFRSVPF